MEEKRCGERPVGAAQGLQEAGIGTASTDRLSVSCTGQD